MSTDARLGNRALAKLTRQGQISVPKAVREALGARAGDEIEFVRQGDAFVVELRPKRSVLDFAGMAADAAARVPAMAEELDVVIARGMAGAAVAREEGTRSLGRQRP